MGYSLFASRKLYYTDMINNINMQLDNIAQAKQGLLTLSANISDGKITADEIASDPKNLPSYFSYITGSEAYKDSQEGAGNVYESIGDYIASKKDRVYTEDELDAINELIGESLGKEYAKEQTRKLVVQENQLDLQQKRLETKLTAAMKQLEAVEQAEARAIQNATPKYAGLG